MLSLKELPVEDVLFSHIFPLLTMLDLHNLKLAMVDCAGIVDAYWGQLKEVEWETVPANLKMIIARQTGSLVSLNLSRTPLVSGELVSLVLQLNTSIKFLILRDCSALTVDAVKPIAHLKKLTVLSVRSNKWANNQFVVMLTASLEPSQLTKVDFSLCPVTDNALEVFFRKFIWLEEIDLENCALITDRTVNAIAAYCPELIHLNIGWCSDIGESPLRCVVSGCLKLKSLRIIDCPRISQRFKESLPKSIFYE